jgi:phage replication-related protein YjqB (UPF0714/DUF867 family)
MPDKFDSMKSLLAAIPAAGNYTFEICSEHQSAIKLFAPHGGCIEPGTRRIVLGLADNRWDYFIFRGIKAHDCYATLHVTSENYDDETCAIMAKSAVLALSIHGREVERSRIEVGGGSVLAPKLLLHLQALGYPAVSASDRVSGRGSRNFVNLAEKGGIQLELSKGFRRYLFTDYPNRPKPTPAFDTFIKDIRAWLIQTESNLGKDLRLA